MARRRRFNRILCSYKLHVGIQFVLSDFQRDGFALNLFPQVTLAHNYQSVLAVGLDWVFGQVNLFVMSNALIESEKARAATIKKNADELGITVQQQKLRWDGY